MGELVNWILEHLGEDLGIDRLADRAALSPRHFRRVFRETFETTPASYIERLRLERACVLLTTGRLAIERVASSVGFSSADAFRRAFRNRYQSSPNEYRARFLR
jgi:transcriptional regulator GlxA family with amidase domain